jgi:putative transposase
MVLDRDLEIEVMEESAAKMVSVPACRRQVAYAQKRGLSCRRACALMSVARSSLSYESKFVERDREAFACLRQVAREYPRWGYRRMRVMLAGRGFEMSSNRAHQLWTNAKLQVPRKRQRRHMTSSHPRPQPATRPNQV